MRNPSAGGLSAAQIRNGELEPLGKRIAAHLRKMRNYEARAQEKAGVELKKGDNHWNSVTQLLVEARKQCDGGGFKAFKERYCPDLSRSRIYELLAIGDGKKTLEETRAGKRERVATSRRKESATTAVADKPAGKQPAQDPEDHTERGEDHGDRGAIERLRKDKGKLESEILGLHIEAVKLQQQCTALRDQREDLQFQTFIKAIEAALTFADTGTHWTLQQLNAEQIKKWSAALTAARNAFTDLRDLAQIAYAAWLKAHGDENNKSSPPTVSAKPGNDATQRSADEMKPKHGALDPAADDFNDIPEILRRPLNGGGNA